MQANPDLAKQFLGSVSFEKKSLGPIMKLFDPNSDVAKDFDNAFKSIPDNAGLAKLGQDASTITKRLNPLDKTARRSRALASTTEQMQVHASGEFLSTQDLEQLRTQAMERGETKLGAALGELILKSKDLGKVKASSAIEAMKGELNRLEHPTTPGRYVGGAPGMEDYSPPQSRPQTEAEKDQAKFLKEQIRVLESIDKNINSMRNREGGMLSE